MRLVGSDVLKFGLSTLRTTRAHKVLGRGWRGLGAVFMLHRVVEEAARPSDFAPNRILEVTSSFLDEVIVRVRSLGYEIIDLDEMVVRLRKGGPGPFAVFTFDDGYLDNRELALPVFEKHDAPFAVYVASDLPDGEADLWWLTLEESIRALDCIEMTIGDETVTHVATTAREKRSAWESVYWRLRDISEDDARHAVGKLAELAGVDGRALARGLSMDWDDVRALHAHPLCTIGAHTATHHALAKLPLERAREDMMAGTARIEAELGMRPSHFAYPYGDEASAGMREFDLASEQRFHSAVTTRKGLLFDEHGNHLRALPRLSLNGDYQDVDFVEVLLGGAPFALWNRFKRVNVA